MAEEIVGQPLTRVTVFQCPSCSRIVRDDTVHDAYPCPWGCGSRLIVLRTEYDAHDADHAAPKGEAEGV